MATANATATANVTLVQVQTLRGNGGHAAALASVQAAVAAHNKANAKAVPHVVVSVPVLPNNTKGMQWQLALYATVARVHGATMVRLSVHNGAVALCGTQAAVSATQAAIMPLYNAYSTAAVAAYNPATHGNRVGFINAYLCGMPAGLQVAHNVATALQYGIGYLYPFAAPANATAYAMGHAAAIAAAKPKAASKPKATKAAATATAAPAAPAATATAATGTTN